MQELQDKIGQSAGEIYNYLNNNGESTFSKMKKELDLKGNFAEVQLSGRTYPSRRAARRPSGYRQDPVGPRLRR